MKFKVNLTTQPESISKRVKKRTEKSRRRCPRNHLSHILWKERLIEHFIFLKARPNLFELPRPSNKESPNLYSLREIVVHLAVCNAKGIRNLIEYLKNSGRIAFTRNTVETNLRKCKNENELPKEDIFLCPPVAKMY